MQIAGRRSEFDAGRNIVLCMTQLNLSARAYHRMLNLVRTIADLAECEEIQSLHLVKALHVHLPCNTPAVAGGTRERSADQVFVYATPQIFQN